MNQTNTITVTVPLMIRLVEWAREDAQSDMALHTVAENLIQLSLTGNASSMQHYSKSVFRLEQ